ncbi:MFS transporter [Dellaglioa sp. BT-FLS60]
MNKTKLLIFTLAFGTFSILNTEVGIIGILPIIATRFQVSITTAGLLVSLFAVIVAISGPIMPVIMGRLNTKHVLLSVLGIFVLSNMVSAYAPNFTVALVGRLIPAVFHPVYCSLAFTLAAKAVDDKESSKAVSRVMMGVSSGMVLGTPITAIIASHVSYRAAMVFFTLVSAVALILNVIFLPKYNGVNSSDKPTKAAENGSMKSILLKRALWISGLGTIAIGASLFSVYGYVSDYLGNVSHFSANQLSFALFFFGLASLVGNLIAGSYLSSKPKQLIRIYPILLIFVYAVMLMINTNVSIMFVIVLVWGIIYGIGNNIQQYLVASSIPEAANFANGLFISLGNIGTTLGITLGGFMLNSVGVILLPFLGIMVLILTLIILFFRNKLISTELNEL